LIGFTVPKWLIVTDMGNRQLEQAVAEMILIL